MNGVLLVDKPRGMTSHDVVGRIRRSSRQRRIGHTGTLDPMATGLLPLVLGTATRLAPFLSGSEKTYDATIRLGVATSTDDAEGQPLGDAKPVPPVTPALIARVQAEFTGTFSQRPPPHSAKKIGGVRAYELARRNEPVELRPVQVTVRQLEVTGVRAQELDVRVTATAGFYVRALARDIGESLGTAGHLTALRRITAAGFSVADAVTFEDAERLGADVAERLIEPGAALPDLPQVRPTDVGLRRILHGAALAAEHLDGPVPGGIEDRPVKVIGADGRLVALARWRQNALHPSVVLG